MDAEPVKKIVDTLLSYGKKKPKVHEKYVRFNRRMLAVTIDSFILMLFLPLINRITPVDTDALAGYTLDPDDPHAGSRLIMHVLNNQEFLTSWFANFFMQMLVWCVFSAVFLHFFSATPGKMVLRMKVVDAKTEGRINDMQVFLRSLGYLISTACFGLGFVWICVNKKRRGWHDYLADTVVISLPMPWAKKMETAPEIATETPSLTEGTNE